MAEDTERLVRAVRPGFLRARRDQPTLCSARATAYSSMARHCDRAKRLLTLPSLARRMQRGMFDTARRLLSQKATREGFSSSTRFACTLLHPHKERPVGSRSSEGSPIAAPTAQVSTHYERTSWSTTFEVLRARDGSFLALHGYALADTRVLTGPPDE